MKLTAASIDLIKSRESCRLTAYRCSAGKWTIGYGHTGDEVHEGLRIDQGEADTLLYADLLRFDAFLQKVCPDATPVQHSAMVSLCFNIGCDAFGRSSVARLHNAGEPAKAAQAFALWNKANGRILAGLVSRRAAEAKLYLSGADQVTEMTDDSSSAQGEKHLTSSRVVSGGTVAAMATGASLTLEAGKQLGEWQVAISQLIPYFEDLRWALLLLALGGISLSIYARLSDRREGRC